MVIGERGIPMGNDTTTTTDAKEKKECKSNRTQGLRKAANEDEEDDLTMATASTMLQAGRASSRVIEPCTGKGADRNQRQGKTTTKRQE